MSFASSWQPGQLLKLESKRFIIRSMTGQDVSDEYVAWWNDPQIMDGFAQPVRNWKKSHALRHVRKFNNINSFHLAIYRKRSNEAVGFLAIFHNKKWATASLNIVVGNKKFWGSHVPREIANTVFPFLFERLEVIKIKTEIASNNRSSLGFIRSLGFMEEGVLRQEKPYYKGGRVEIHVFGLLADEWQTNTNK